MMTVLITSLFASILVLPGVNSIGCLNRRGLFKCTDDQLCMTRRKLCDPPDMSTKCRCRTNNVQGCADRLLTIVCQNNEECLNKTTGEPCRRVRSSDCECTPSPTNGPGCYVTVDATRAFIPLDSQFHDLPGVPCTECICRTDYRGYVEYCRKKSYCNGGFVISG